MHPILINIGGLKLYAYGLFVALGFITAMLFSKRQAKKNAINPEVINDLVLIILVSAIAGSRILYVVINFSFYKDDFPAVFKIWDGGLVFYGGFVLALASSILYVRLKGLSFFQTADIISPSLALGHAVGRIGCFFAGCCYGKPSSLPWAVTFTDPNSLAPLGVPLHPTQLYSVISNLLIFFLLLFLSRIKKYHGMVFFSYIILYSAFRFVIEMFRGDFRGSFLNSALSMSQGVGVILSVVSVIILFCLYFRHRYGAD